MSRTDITLPLVSIVIPSYNHGRYLGAAIESILAQDYPRIELIVIDDGSTDDSREVLAKYAGQFHWEVQSNMGQVATLNKGWEMSRGEILGYLSADDLLYPAAVSRAVQCLGTNPDAVLSYCDFDLIDPDSALVRRIKTPEFDYPKMVIDIVCPPGPGAFFTRNAFENAGRWDSSFRQMLDYEYWLRLGLHGRFVRIPESLAAYRVHSGSQTFAASDQIRPEEPVRIIEHYFDSSEVPGEIRAFRQRALGTAHLLAAQLHLRIGNYREGVSALRKAFSLNPSNLVAMRTLRILFNVLFNRMAHQTLWTLRRARRTLKAGSERNQT